MVIFFGDWFCVLFVCFLVISFKCYVFGFCGGVLVVNFSIFWFGIC